MKSIHIVFNIDYSAKSGLSFFRDSVVRHIKNSMIEIPTFEQFRTLILNLGDCRCYIWVHPSLGSEIAQGYEVGVMTDVVPELERLGIKYLKVSRSNDLRQGLCTVSQMPTMMAGHKSYLTSELKDIISKDEPQTHHENDQMNQEDKLKATKKILIVTATQLEASIFVKCMEEYQRLKYTTKSIKKLTFWDFGKIRNSELLMIKLSDLGSSKSGGSTLVIKDAIDISNPDYIVMVGIAFGMKRSSQEIGQILISKELENYESSKISENITIGRGHKIPAGITLFNRFDNSRITYDLNKVSDGLVISGDKLLDSKPFIESLILRYPEAIGGEMEGTGLQSSCHREGKEWILIKGICDWGYDKQHANKDRDQELAIRNVCDFLLYTLNRIDF